MYQPPSTHQILLFLAVASLALLCIAIIMLPQYTHNAILRDIRQSHIDGNVPNPQDFDTYMKRELQNEFRAPQVDYELLRKTPSQVGVATPKFYAWVRIPCDRQPCQEGAVTVAAIGKTRFEVLEFVSKAEIVRDPDTLAQRFPPAAVPIFLEKAGVR